MKFIHLSDLHLGKRLNEYSLIEDQEYILTKIINIIDDEKPDGVLIAGDVYDKSVPSAEAVELFDDFLTRLAKRSLQVFVISGNHDSPERMAFGARLMDQSGIHISRVYDGDVIPYEMTDGDGKVNIYLLPFVKPAHVRRWTDEDVETYTDAIRVAVDRMNMDKNERNVLVTHQFITGSARTESEEISVGGTDNVDVSVFDGIDYVALGHIHSPQNCTSTRVRYCGTPLKYSFSESNDNKSVTVAELGKKGELTVRTVPLVPKRDMVEVKGTYDELMLKSFYENTSYREDYMHITLTDEEDIIDAVGKLRVVYRNLMKLDYDNTRTRSTSLISGNEAVETKTPLELFSDLYEQQNNQPMSEEQTEFMKKLIENVWEDEK
ncbi:MAG: exonuclease SbcCD subunit D [Clostridia bacterium]|nr:exonuclease SbcCD subunit D [Clostridia bacterium]